MSQNRLHNNFTAKCNETLPRTLCAEICILAVYAKYMAPPTKSMSWMAAETLEQEQQLTFQWKKNKNASVSRDVSTQNQRKK